MADTSTPLVNQFNTSLAELLQALEDTNFYIALLFVGVTVTVACLLGWLLRRQVLNKAAQPTERTFSASLLVKPSVLLAPFFCIIALAVVRPFAAQYTGDVGWISAAISISVAWLLIRISLLFIRSKPMAWFISIVITLYTALSLSGFMAPTLDYLSGLSFEIGSLKLSMLMIIKGLIIFVMVFWVAGSINGFAESYLRRTSSLSYNARELIAKFFTIFVYFVAFTVALSAIGVDLTAFAVFGGALGVGIGLGLQKITANFVSGVTLLLEKSIKIGDLIEVGGNTGWVRHLHMRYALLETFDGREILIPNEELVSTRVTNWTLNTDRARVDITVGIGYDSDVEKATEIMLEAARSHERCIKDPAPMCVLEEFGDNALIFKLYFWVMNVRDGRAEPRSDVMKDILRRFREAGINIPFPQRDVHLIRQAKP